MTLRDDILTNFDCDPERGAFYPRRGLWSGIPVICTRSTRGQKYPSIGFSRNGIKTVMSCHRAMWIVVNGCSPSEQIDHINTVAGDYRISNLRLVTSGQNSQNKPLESRKGKFVGVTSVSRKKWSASICVDGISIKLGSFESESDAAMSYAEAKKRMHFFDPAWHEAKGMHVNEISNALGGKKEFMRLFGCSSDRYKQIMKAGGYSRIELIDALRICEINGINATYASLIQEDK